MGAKLRNRVSDFGELDASGSVPVRVMLQNFDYHTASRVPLLALQSKSPRKLLSKFHQPPPLIAILYQARIRGPFPRVAV